MKYKPALMHLQRYYVTAPLGTTVDKLTTEDTGKFVVRPPIAGATNAEQVADNYVLVATGAPFETICISVETDQPTQDGFVMGSVLIPEVNKSRLHVINDNATALKVGDLVIAGNNNAAHTAAPNLLRVRKSGASDHVFRWQVVSLMGGSGAINTEVVIAYVGHGASIPAAAL